jgi:diguanylate cyclase
VLRSGGASLLRWLVGSVIAVALGCVGAAGVLAAGGGPAQWWRVVACAGLASAGYLLQFSVRLGNQRLIFAWGAAAVCTSLVLEPPPWTILTMAAGMVVAAIGPPGRNVLKAGFNTALYVTGSAVAAVVYTGLGPVMTAAWLPLRLALMCLVALAFLVVVDVGVQAVLGVAGGRPFAASFWADWQGRALHVAAELGVVVCVVAAAAVSPRLLFGVPVLAVCLQQGHRGVVAAAAERKSAERVFQAIQAFSVTDEVVVARLAAEQILALLSADAVEVLLHGADDPPRQEVLVRVGRDDARYIGRPGDAPPLAAGHVAALRQAGEQGADGAELRVYFAAAVKLNERERAAVRTLVAALAAALGTARAHADLALMAARAAHEASHDSLTGLPGRRLFLTRMGERLAELTAAGDEAAVAVTAVHISGWPDLLEACGADVADHLIGHAAGQLRSGASLGELVGHLGGDTFVVFFTEAVSVQHVQDRIRALLNLLASPVVLETGPVVLSGAAGVAYAPPSTTTADDLLRQARVALRQAHHCGVDVHVYRPEEDIRGPAAIVLGSELRTALKRDQLRLYYQVAVDLNTGAPVSVEALPRWLHPTLGMMPASAWIDLLQTSNLAPDYLQWLLPQALGAWAEWTAAGVSAPVSVNIPGRALLDPALPGIVHSALTAAAAPPSALTLELAESRALVGLEVIDRVLAELAHARINLAIDDFGSAHSSLARLRRVPATEIKLASDYSHDILTDVESRAIVGAVVGLADQLDLRVTAVDIPSPDHATALARLGVTTGQGPCLYPPLPGSHIQAALQRASASTAIPASAEIIALRQRRSRT